MIGDKCVEYSVKTRNTAAGVLKLLPCGVNTLGELRQLLEGVYQLPRTIRKSEAHIQSLQLQGSSHPAEPELVQSEAGQLEVPLEAVNCQFSVSQASFISAEATHDESRALFDAEAQNRQDLEEIFAKVRRCLGHHSSLLRLAHEMFLYDVNWTLRDYLRPLLDAVPEHTVAFRSTASNPVEMHGKTQSQSASSVASYVNLHLSSSVTVTKSGSTTFNQFGPSGPSSAWLVTQQIVLDNFLWSFLVLDFCFLHSCGLYDPAWVVVVVVAF